MGSSPVVSTRFFMSSSLYPVIFIHGIAADFAPWTPAILKMKGEASHYEMRYQTKEKIFHNFDGGISDSGPSFWNVSYYLDRPLQESFFGHLEEYAVRLQSMIRLIQKLTGQPKVILVAHSMGGLVARRFMTLDGDSWNSVHKILTVGTPHEGVFVSPKLIPQFRDLQPKSEFLRGLNDGWERHSASDVVKKWGVVGAVSRLSPLRGGLKTDAAGPGFVAIASSIPFGEWEEAIQAWDIPALNTAHFGFRVVTQAGHNELLDHPATFEAIQWAFFDY